MINFALFLTLCVTCPLNALAQGSFKGAPKMEWIEEPGIDRKMKLLEPLAFTDSAGKTWSVPAGQVVDGASIPKVFWSTIGPPFVGDYRRASVIHDYYCNEKTESWESVHKMFEHAAIAGGVSSIQAKVMWAAIYAGGPRWKKIKRPKQGGIYPLASEQIVSSAPIFDEDAFNGVVKWIIENDPDTEAIKNRLDAIVKDTLPQVPGTDAPE